MPMNMVSHLSYHDNPGILADQPGFPSSHSTNSVSIALYFAQWLLEERESVGSTTVIAGITCKSLACALEDIS
jgi:membrane-associated phospholipid phosphatase